MKNRLITFLLAAFFSAVVVADSTNNTQKVHVNSATIQQLDDGLIGVGKRVAMEIVNHRDTHGPFQSLDDLDKVKYVGKKILEKNKDRISFD